MLTLHELLGIVHMTIVVSHPGPTIATLIRCQERHSTRRPEYIILEIAMG